MLKVLDSSVSLSTGIFPQVAGSYWVCRATSKTESSNDSPSTLCYGSFLHFPVTANQKVQNYLPLAESIQSRRRIVDWRMCFKSRQSRSKAPLALDRSFWGL